jgi:hypothetical protein
VAGSTVSDVAEVLHGDVASENAPFGKYIVNGTFGEGASIKRVCEICKSFDVLYKQPAIVKRNISNQMLLEI